MDDKSTLYELEFPAPQVTGDEGDGPVLVHALEGFADAGHAIKLASDHLRQSLESELVATFSTDELMDYRSRRPLMTFTGDQFTDVAMPELTLHAVRDNNGTPFLLLSGAEPDLRWERFVAVRLPAFEPEVANMTRLFRASHVKYLKDPRDAPPVRWCAIEIGDPALAIPLHLVRLTCAAIRLGSCGVAGFGDGKEKYGGRWIGRVEELVAHAPVGSDQVGFFWVAIW